jgi:hypothetical protein
MGTWARACGQLDGVAICVSKGHESRVWTKKVCLCEVGWCPYWNIVGVVFCFFSFWEYRSMYGLFFPFCPKLEVFVSNYHFSEKKKVNSDNMLANITAYLNCLRRNSEKFSLLRLDFLI